jgi:hypothetical protein
MAIIITDECINCELVSQVSKQQYMKVQMIGDTGTKLSGKVILPDGTEWRSTEDAERNF